MDEHKLLNILNGNFDSIPNKTSKSIRIFLSSTFSGNIWIVNYKELISINKIIKIFLFLDTHTERGNKALFKYIYPDHFI